MIFNLTRSALEKVHELMHRDGKQGYALRLGVKGGGCSGFSYVMDFDQPKPDDIVKVFDEVLVVVCDPKSIKYLNNIEIDYSKSLNDMGFKFNNPTAKRSCSCGTSFAL